MTSLCELQAAGLATHREHKCDYKNKLKYIVLVDNHMHLSRCLQQSLSRCSELEMG